MHVLTMFVKMQTQSVKVRAEKKSSSYVYMQDARVCVCVFLTHTELPRTTTLMI